MAKKKVIKKTSKKKISKEIAKPVSQKKALVAPSKFRLVLKNLILFGVLAVISYVLSIISKNQIYIDFFLLLTWILAFIGVAFLISLLVLWFLKGIKR